MKHDWLTIVFAALALLATGARVLAAAPTDEDVQRAIDRYFQQREEMIAEQTFTPEESISLRADALRGISVSELSVMQMVNLSRAGILDHEVRHDLVAARVRSLMDQEDSAGAGAASLALEVIGAPRFGVHADAEVQIELIRGAINHPALAEAMRSGDAGRLFEGIARQKIAAKRATTQEILSLALLLNEHTSPIVALGVEDLIEVVRELTKDEDVRETFRVRAVAVAKRALAHDEQKSIFTEAEREWLSGQIARLDGAAARGELIGHPAPKLDFIWSYPKEYKSLADLKGKVVVLDFWATWCGPCVASFPNVRDLAAHYNTFPVEIIGVTSIQGSHIDPDQGVIDTRDDPEKELALMERYVEQQFITWTIAFSEQNVYNPDFGVRGIPHVAIIDPEGVVRHSGLHPGRPIAEKIELIDAILREFDLPTPAQNPPAEP